MVKIEFALCAEHSSKVFLLINLEPHTNALGECLHNLYFTDGMTKYDQSKNGCPKLYNKQGVKKGFEPR